MKNKKPSASNDDELVDYVLENLEEIGEKHDPFT